MYLLLFSLDEKTDLHYICAVQMSVNLVQSRRKCGANGVNPTFALDLHGVENPGANVAFTPFAPHLLQLWTRFTHICTAQIWCKSVFSSSVYNMISLTKNWIYLG